MKTQRIRNTLESRRSCLGLTASWVLGTTTQLVNQAKSTRSSLNVTALYVCVLNVFGPPRFTPPHATLPEVGQL